MNIIRIAALVLLTFAQNQVRADEGMWLLNLAREVNMAQMQELGLQLSAEDIYSVNQSSLKDAIGALNYGECTAELVSGEGLLLTNHHCGYDDVQAHSTVEKDYLKNGFWAMSREEELPNPGKTITFLVRVEEVTDEISYSLTPNMEEHTRAALIRSLSQKIENRSVSGTQYEASVRSMFKDNRFFLFVTQTYRDVRLVGTPPESIGKFGGETDNWTWPRHTGDFSMFRVYTGPDGKPADYHPDNIPMKSESYLPISLEGYSESDFAMVLGYPGRTYRYLTSWEVEELLEQTHPNRIRIRGLKLKLQKEDMDHSERVRLQYAAKYTGAYNYYKHSIGQSKGLVRLGVVEEKQTREEAFRTWLDQDPERAAVYGGALEEIRASVEARREVKNAEQYLMECVRRGRGMESVYFARHLESFASALVLADDMPESLEDARMNLEGEAEIFFRDYNADTDKKVMSAMIRLLIDDLEDEYLPANILDVKYRYKGKADKYVDRYFRKSFVVDRERFMAFLEKPKLKVLQKDPAFMAFLASKKHLEVQGKLEAFNKQAEIGHRLYMKGMTEMLTDQDFYPDANSTFRMSYGTVGDYQPRDAVQYNYFTTLAGVMEKEDPENPEFHVPGKLKELYAAGDFAPYGSGGKLNVCFTTNNDITGGNSGSPVLNSRGEMLGLVFDSNWEGVSGEIAFSEDMQRCICLDIRYVLFIIEKFAGAGHLVEEMKLLK